MMKWNQTIIAAGALVCSINGYAGQIDGGAVVGSMLGAGVGSAVGSSAGGRDGAIIGGGVGGALGAAIGSNQEVARSSTQTQVVSQERVIYVDQEKDRKHKKHHHHDQGNHYGEYKHGRD